MAWGFTDIYRRLPLDLPNVLNYIDVCYRFFLRVACLLFTCCVLFTFRLLLFMCHLFCLRVALFIWLLVGLDSMTLRSLAP